MQYIPCNSALLAQETLFLTQKGTFLPKDLQKVRKSRQILLCDKIVFPNAECGLNYFGLHQKKRLSLGIICRGS